jgi:hypothetical protein
MAQAQQCRRRVHANRVHLNYVAISDLRANGGT